jgi:hypothetical protein
LTQGRVRHGLVEQQAHGLLQHQRRLVQILERAQALAAAGGFPAQGQGGHQPVEEVEDIIGGRAFERLPEDQQRGQAALLAHAQQGLGPGQLGVPGQARQPGFGQILHGHFAHAQVPNLVQAAQGSHQGGGGNPGGGRAQHFQRSETLPRPHL